jgi:hypothetical protein
MAGLMVKTYDLLLRKQNALAVGLISQNTQNLQGKRQLSKVMGVLYGYGTFIYNKRTNAPCGC